LIKSTEKKVKINIFKYLKNAWPSIRTWVVRFLLTRFLPKVFAGPWGWVVAFFSHKIFDKVLQPTWNFLTRKAYAISRRFFRKKKVEKFENAKNENDFDDSFDNMP